LTFRALRDEETPQRMLLLPRAICFRNGCSEEEFETEFAALGAARLCLQVFLAQDTVNIVLELAFKSDFFLLEKTA
jgi:hypothetical protein